MKAWAEQARVLLRKAQGDLHVLQRLADDEAAPPWVFGFHAQQAVEKALKAALAQGQIEYPFTHDIETLIKLLRTRGQALPPSPEDLPRLTPFGALWRYEDEPETDLGDLRPDAILSLVAQCVRWAETLVSR
ncbi:MAG TPA: HEPN domain-containing protein [Candidatus Brocadiia bacterium]|nr:HEPN domain-containing protein [Candidatus Brocadiia bacterium]